MLKHFFYFILFALCFSYSSSLAQVKKPKLVDVKWSFEYLKGFPGKIEVYEVSPDKFEDATQTRNVSLESKIPVIRKIPSSFKMRTPYGFIPLALVITNNTDKDWYFFADFHNYIPPENSLGVRISCLCNNHVFKVRAKSKWYRIVKVELRRRFYKDNLEINHQIVNLTEEEMKQRNLLGPDSTKRFD